MSGVISGPKKLLQSKRVSILLLLRLSSFCMFWHVFLLHICLSRRKFSVAVILLFLEPKAKTLRCAQRLRGTDGDGVYPAEGRKKGEKGRVKGEERDYLRQRTFQFAVRVVNLYRTLDKSPGVS